MSGVDDLSSATVHEAPEPCRACMWWQTRPGRREPDRERWMAATEESFGAWGKLYRDGDRTVGMIQYGPAERFARSRVLPGGPPSPDAVLVTCAYLVDERSPWVLQSLFLAAIGESRDRRFPALEAFAYGYGRGELFASRFMTHRTVFPKDFLSDFGFHTLRAAGRVELMRLELGGLEPVAERGRLERVKARFAPVPARLAAP